MALVPKLRISVDFSVAAKADLFETFLTDYKDDNNLQNCAIKKYQKPNGNWIVSMVSDMAYQRDLLYAKEASEAELANATYSGSIVTAANLRYWKHMCSESEPLATRAACSEVTF